MEKKNSRRIPPRHESTSGIEEKSSWCTRRTPPGDIYAPPGHRSLKELAVLNFLRWVKEADPQDISGISAGLLLHPGWRMVIIFITPAILHVLHKHEKEKI